MEGNNQKERLEQELRFLKESYEAEVISKEEFEKGKDRVEKKLKEIEAHEPDAENKPQEPEKPAKTEALEQNLTQPSVEKTTEKTMPANTETEKSEAKREEPEKEAEEESEAIPAPKENKAFKYALVFVVFILVAFFAYSLFAGKNTSIQNNDEAKLSSVCTKNDDCVKGSLQGICTNPGAKDAKCEYIEIKKTKVVVLNGREDCFNCGTERVLSILSGWFGELEVNEIDYDAKEGNELAGLMGVRMLPAYIIYGNITNDPEFTKFRRAFVSKGDAYVLSEDAAASTLYLQRESIPNKLDLFAKEGDSATAKAENNLKEFLENFPYADYDVHYADDALTKELGIRTFPTFLVNNRVKFSGIHTADTIKDNFCSLNKVEECRKELSTNLIQ